MNTVDDLIPISAIQHYSYCPRRCYLVQRERLWSDNYFTAEGNIGHENVDVEHHEKRPSVYKSYRLSLTSKTIGLTGFADLVEFVPDDAGVIVTAIHQTNQFRIVPVEYKRGTAKDDTSYKLQLSAQALCLEEMFETSVPIGYLFEEKRHHRLEVIIDSELRKAVVLVVTSIREMIAQDTAPKAVFTEKCKNCSLRELCVPVLSKRSTASSYWKSYYSCIKEADDAKVP